MGALCSYMCFVCLERGFAWLIVGVFSFCGLLLVLCLFLVVSTGVFVVFLWLGL